MTTVVQKYGGSSVATVARIGMVADRIARTRAAGLSVVVVVSATGDTTDELLRLAARVSAAPHPRETDQLLATGECASAALLAMALRERGVPAVSLTGGQAGFRVSGPHGGGSVERIRTGRVESLLAAGNVVVVAGFQGVNAAGDVVTLGRGGSDTSAVALAAELRARTCQIYTDVAGVFTADPRIVPAARLLHVVPAGVMAELAFAGARVLHARSVELAQMSEVDIEVRDSASDGPGTLVESRRDVLEERSCVVAVADDRDVVLVTTDAVPPGALLHLLAEQAVQPDLFAFAAPGRCGFTVTAAGAARLREPLACLVAAAGGEAVADAAVGKVSLVGTGLLSRPQLTAQMLSELAVAGIAPSWVGASQSRVSAVVPAADTVRAAVVLHRAFGLDRAPATAPGPEPVTA
ncbi:aspartate kinase [Phytohabitans sp. ZYX-F-186]|uniref:Aspartokinase n=1 Tax=Phytohabitans maris TaxID=3071409 RepID=A0ABU0ZGX9_9ACTN|nr:aspartate kinase [Phytohabitans sp. ZYX-F-186]MDQ7905664.1 aspartate kinase [Phytohabitans sp. ZYX-F-186]